MRCFGPKAKDADLWMLIWGVHRIHQEGILLDVEHVEAKRRSNVGWRRNGSDESQHSSAEKRAGVRSLAVCSRFSLDGGGVARLWRTQVEAGRHVGCCGHRMEWCAGTSKNRCVRCGRSSINARMPGMCEGPRWMGKDVNHKLTYEEKAHLGERDMVIRLEPT